MKTLPAIGTRVIYRRDDGSRTCAGTVMAHYRGGDKHTDPETGKRYTTPDHVGIKVDAPLPPWWPYGGTDRFAPSVAEVSLEVGAVVGR